MSPIHTGSDAASLDGPFPPLVSEEALDLEEKGDLLIETAQEEAGTDTASPDESDTLALALEENAVLFLDGRRGWFACTCFNRFSNSLRPSTPLILRRSTSLRCLRPLDPGTPCGRSYSSHGSL